MIASPGLCRRKISVALLAVSFCLAAGSVRAQLAPSQPIKIVVGVPAGGLGDLAARVLAQRLSENGHPAIVENRLGGNGIVATDAVCSSADQTHDAALELYHSRFGMQVEVVTVAQLIEAKLDRMM